MGVPLGAVDLGGAQHDSYFKVPLDLYKDGDVVERDIYLLYQGNYIVYRARNTRWTAEDTRKLSEFGAVDLFINCKTDGEHFKFLESNLNRILQTPGTPTRQKTSVLYQCASGIAENVFNNPYNSENFAKTKKVVSHTIELLAKDSDAFFNMISLSSHDYYTYTHCVNVMTFTISLLSALGVRDKKLLEESATGAFLHDIGKTKVPISILNKPGPLTEEEWKIMKKHPEWGLDILQARPIPERGKDIIIQHHEKINGIGYPYGLRGDKIQMVSQVVSICDAYDAMTTNRCYQTAKTPFDAFQIIAKDMRGHFNTRIVETFIELLNSERQRESLAKKLPK